MGFLYKNKIILTIFHYKCRKKKKKPTTASDKVIIRKQLVLQSAEFSVCARWPCAESENTVRAVYSLLRCTAASLRVCTPVMGINFNFWPWHLLTPTNTTAAVFFFFPLKAWKMKSSNFLLGVFFLWSFSGWIKGKGFNALNHLFTQWNASFSTGWPTQRRCLNTVIHLYSQLIYGQGVKGLI